MKTFIQQLIVVFILSTLSIGGYAHNNVVIIPMAGDDIMPEPFAPLAKNATPDEDYTITYNHTVTIDDDTVIDEITGLQWQRSDAHNSTSRIWITALNYCGGLTLDNKSDWRLPLIAELHSIVDYDVTTPSINTTAFPSALASYYWSASSFANSVGSAWTIYFIHGHASSSNIANTRHVRCVRSTPRPVGPMFQDNDNGTVPDFATGLTWQQSDAHNGSGRNHSAAITYCDGLSLAGSGWRLPEIKELSSIIDLRGYNPSVDLHYFPGMKPSGYWSASSFADLVSNAWRVDFDNGYDHDISKGSTDYVRCVR